jgi:hypothetical protein
MLPIKDTRHADSASSSSPSTSSSTRPRRRSSAFFEEGLKGEDALVDARLRRFSRPSQRVRFRSKVDVHEADNVQTPLSEKPPPVQDLPPFFPTISRIMFFTLLLAVIVPSLGNSPFFKAGVSSIGAKAGPIAVPIEEQARSLPAVAKRQDTNTDICKRWSGQSAIVNGTMYYYGGRATTESDQTTNQWSESRYPSDLAILTVYRQRLPRPRPHKKLADRLAFTDRPPTTLRTSRCLARLPLELLQFAIFVRWTVLRLTRRESCAIRRVAIRYCIVTVVRTRK